jgi:2-(1,2-epoxy-1,2-dihydrophenyl)acetyl-CoA isomerase
MSLALQTALSDAANDPEVRCVVLTGSGDFFSAGQDLREFHQAENPSYREHVEETYNPLILQLRRIEKPVLASIRGAVAGAALGIALACDLRIVAEGTRFTVGFLGVGLVPDSAVSLLLPAMIGLSRATELAFSNAPFDAEQAMAWGIANRVVPANDLELETAKWAAQLAQGPIRVMGISKATFNRAILHNLEDVLSFEAKTQSIAQGGYEHQEGVQAFLEKRSPVFNPKKK